MSHSRKREKLKMTQLLKITIPIVITIFIKLLNENTAGFESELPDEPDQS